MRWLSSIGLAILVTAKISMAASVADLAARRWVKAPPPSVASWTGFSKKKHTAHLER